MQYSDRYLLFVEYFNTGKFMSAQTTLDKEWINETGERKTFLGGLIQASVSLYHLTNGNPRGAPIVWKKARAMLEPSLPSREGVDLQKLFEDMDTLYENLPEEELSDMDYMKMVPQVKFDNRKIPRVFL